MIWEDMTPRQRDALVAEKVMGWTKIHIGEDGEPFWGETADGCQASLCDYTTDRVKTWCVVEQMHREGWQITIKGLRPHDRNIPVDIPGEVYGLFRKEHARGEARGEDEPATICRAALRAIGVDV